MTATPSPWSRALAWHRRAALAFVESLEAVPEERWSEPLAAGKWTVAQLAEHIELSYSTALAALAGGPGMRLVLPWWKTQFLRLTVLRRILAGRGFPEGAPAPREIRPGKTPAAREPAIAALRARLIEIERALAAAPPHRRLPHAYFGMLRSEQLLGVQAAHLDHHRRQLERLRSAVLSASL